ncbi:MAG TPA: glycosyltransferase [Gemmatimonadaceae bacterium]|nr:glycosyltransferase [Gemmatimonadaceae bacterium]
MSATAPLLWTLPWILPPVAALVRSSKSRSLDDVAADAPRPAPLVSVIVPARNEQRNIERCVQSVLATQYPSLEVIVVNDHSTDETGAIARAIATDDPRLVVIDAPDLPDGWFGKQWACATGARVARGELLLFTDADTRHAPDLLPRATNALRDRDASLLSIAGHQEMHSFWERIVQPQMFALLSIRYGGTEQVSNARRAEDVIANGQFILVRRDAYDAVGGHAAVRDRVAEDLALGQEFFRAGRRIVLMLALHQFSTHMYASLREVIEGWRKNIYAGGRHAAIGGRIGRRVYPAMLLAIPMFGLVPPVALLLAATGALSAGWLLWSASVVGVSVLFWAAIYRFMGQSVSYALLYPLGLATLLYIAVGAVRRGHRVEWKDRTYVAT